MQLIENQEPDEVHTVYVILDCDDFPLDVQDGQLVRSEVTASGFYTRELAAEWALLYPGAKVVEIRRNHRQSTDDQPT